MKPIEPILINAAVALALVLLAAPVTARAQAADGRALAATCTGCHGTDGVSAGGMPALAGVDKARIVELMGAFRSGARPATVMHQLAAGFSDEQIDAIAGWFADRPAPASPAR